MTKNITSKLIKFSRILFFSLPIFATFFLLTASPKAYGGNCDNLKFIFARGSGSTTNTDKEFVAFKSEIETIMSTADKAVQFSIFDLGSDPSVPNAYPAVKVFPNILKINADFFDHSGNTFGAFFSGGEAFDYGASVDKGVAELLGNIRQTLTVCPTTRFVLSGFSQGAQVVSETLSYLNHTEQEAIVYSALFGDPKLNLPEGRGIFPEACFGENRSIYNVWNANCYISSGSLGARDPYLPDNLLAKTGTWCNFADVICGGFTNLRYLPAEPLPTAGHADYVADGHIRWAANIIKTRIKKHLKKYTAGEQIWADEYTPVSRQNNEKSAPYDITIFLDLERLASFDQLANLEKEVIGFTNLLPSDGNTRISIADNVGDFPYANCGEQNSVFVTTTFCLEHQFSLIRNYFIGGWISRDSFTFDRTTVSFNNSLEFLLRSAHWRHNAAHSLVVFSPDKNTNLETLSSQIKPDLNIEVYGNEHYTELAAAQYRPILSYDKSSDCLYINRCHIFLSSKYANTGEPVLFEIQAQGISSPIDHYEWDFFGDGSSVVITSEPFVSHIFLPVKPYGFYTTVKAVDKLGKTSRFSWYTSIRTQKPVASTKPDNLATNLNFTPSPETSSGVLSWEVKPTRTRASSSNSFVVHLNGFPLGQVDLTTHQIEIRDLDFSKEFTLSLTTIANQYDTSETSATTVIPALFADENTEGSKTLTLPNLVNTRKPTSLRAPRCSFSCQ